jgi:hypothetical protein
MALRLHHEVPGIEVPGAFLCDLEEAGRDAAQVGYRRAIDMAQGASQYAQGVYVIAPFKKPEAVLPLIEDSVMGPP